MSQLYYSTPSTRDPTPYHYPWQVKQGLGARLRGLRVLGSWSGFTPHEQTWNAPHTPAKRLSFRIHSFFVGLSGLSWEGPYKQAT